MNFKERYVYDPGKDELGSGGLSIVFLATDTKMHRKVALNFCGASFKKKYSIIEEVKKVAVLHPRNIIHYYDYEILDAPTVHGGVEKVEVGIMEYLDNGNLKSFTLKNPQYTHQLLIDTLKG